MSPNFERELYQGERVFSPIEVERLSPRFREELMRLLYAGSISQMETERIIVEAIKLNRPNVDYEEFLTLLALVIDDPERVSLMIPPNKRGCPEELN